MPLGLQNAYGLASLDDLLARRRREKIEAEERQQQLAQQEFENAMRVGELQMRSRPKPVEPESPRVYEVGGRLVRAGSTGAAETLFEPPPQPPKGELRTVGRQLLRVSPEGQSEVLHTAPAEITPYQAETLERQRRQDTEKEESRQAAEQRAQGEERRYATDVLSTIQNIRKRPTATGYAVGPITGRVPFAEELPGTADVVADIDRLRSLMDINELRRLKAQSRTGATGFGQLSEKELAILENAASKLRRNQSEASFKAELSRIEQIFQRMQSQAQPSSPTNPGASIRERFRY